MRRVLAIAAAAACCGAQAGTVILYARADEAHAAYLEAVLGLAGEQTGRDVNLAPGVLWRPAIAAAICQADTVLVLWSARAAASPEVAAEWRLAAACARRLVPVLLDATPMPAELGARQAIMAPR